MNMNLGTFGSILEFAIELENKVMKVYEENKVTSYEKIYKEHQYRIQKLKRLRRENTTEMILEPIKDFTSSTFEIKDKDSTIKAKNKLAEFYATASIKLNFLNEVCTVFNQFKSQILQEK